MDGIEHLLNAKKIIPQEHLIYLTFGVSELGRKWMSMMLDELFMDCAAPPDMTPEILAYLEGRRSILREIKLCMFKVEELLKEENYVR